jgi:hypothetical protein
VRSWLAQRGAGVRVVEEIEYCLPTQVRGGRALV